MKAKEKTKKQLISELAEMRKKVNKLETLVIQGGREDALRESEEKYRLLAENATDVIWTVDMDLNVTYMSPSVYRVRGYTPEEIMAMKLTDQLTLDSVALATRVLSEELAIEAREDRDLKRSRKLELEFFCKDCSTYWSEVNLAFIRDSQGKAVGILGVSRDITERKRAEEALRQNEERYRTVLEDMQDGYFEIDLAGNYTFVNDVLCRRIGYSGEELIGMNYRVFTDPKTIEKVFQAYNELYRTGKPIRGLDGKVIRKNGTEIILEVWASLMRDSEGKPIGFRGVSRDITERKRVENRLRESESRFRDLVENALTGIYIMQDGQIVYKNPEQDRIFGPLPEPYHFNDFRNVHPEDVEKVKGLYEKILSGEISNFDVDMRFFPGGEMDDTADMRWVQARAREIEYQGGRAILINMTDITRARELEHLMRVDDKMTSLGRAAAGIIHELRNPLSGINVYLTTLKKIYNQPDKNESESLEKVDEVIEKMQSASNKIESVIKRVMDFSKPSIPRLALTNVNISIQEAIGLSAATLRKYGIRVETSLRKDLPQCFTDSHLIEEVLLNLILNASQAMENTVGEKIIEITSSAEGNSILIGVADSGPGVPSVLRKKIFDPFFTTKKDSSGIGLSVCHRIIADHGGSLNVLTSKWGGAEFRVEIPIEKRKDAR